jgi:hypothetical protein
LIQQIVGVAVFAIDVWSKNQEYGFGRCATYYCFLLCLARKFP